MSGSAVSREGWYFVDVHTADYDAGSRARLPDAAIACSHEVKAQGSGDGAQLAEAKE